MCSNSGLFYVDTSELNSYRYEQSRFIKIWDILHDISGMTIFSQTDVPSFYSPI